MNVRTTLSTLLRGAAAAIVLTIPLSAPGASGDSMFEANSQPAAVFARDARLFKGEAPLPPRVKRAISHPAAITLDIPFVANDGQVDERVAFYTRTPVSQVFVTRKGELVYAFPGANGQPAGATTPASSEGIPGRDRGIVIETLQHTDVIDVRGEDRAATTVNYLHGNDRAKWRRHVPTFDAVSLGEAYPGIEVRLRTAHDYVEKLFIIEPHADPAAIRVKVSGAVGLEVTGKGPLSVETNAGSLTLTKPVAYQDIDGARRFVDVAYVAEGDEYGFRIGPYDPGSALVIDPVLAATYLGGSDFDDAQDMVVSAMGDVYVAGYTDSWDFPGIDSNSPDDIFNTQEVFVAKLDSGLSTLVATYLGGDGFELGTSIALDGAGKVYVAGMNLTSSNFPGIGTDSADSALDPNGDGFVTRLSADLSTIEISSYFGGDGTGESTTDMVVTQSEVYLCGVTSGSPSAFAGIDANSADDNFGGAGEGFVVSLSPDLDTIQEGTYLGGSSNNDLVSAIKVDGTGNVYAAGNTQSSDFPGISAGCCADDTLAGQEGFVVKLDADLTTIQAATFVGGTNGDSARDLALDAGNVFVVGTTDSTDLPGIDADSADGDFAGPFESYIVRLDSGLTTLDAATYLGGNDNDQVSSIAVDGNGDVFASGFTRSSDFPGVGDGAADSTLAGSDAFIAKVNPDLTSILAATFLGGENDDFASGLALGQSGAVYVTGGTESEGFPGISNLSADSEFMYVGQGFGDGFVAKLDADLSDNPPDCAAAVPSLALLLKRNGKFYPVDINDVTDPDGDTVTLTIQGIEQDEPVTGYGTSQNKCPDANGVGDMTATVRAERSDQGDGRVYHIGFEASDGHGPTCTGTVTVCVPHDQSDTSCVDQGPLYDSTTCP